jgi:hypothetical protein
VSNLPYLSKVIEKVVVGQVDSHMTDKALYASHQSAYRKGHSTETALVKILDDVLCSVDRSKCVFLVLLDQSAAFDTVNQEYLLHRLDSTYGIRDSALAWMKSYFKGRTQSVNISGVSSKSKILNTGFPQGSVIGPFKYPMYTSELFSIAERHGICIHMYADDTQLYASFEPNDCKDKMLKLEACIREIREWMEQNHLKLNDKKTEFLVIGNQNVLSKTGDVSSLSVGNSTVKDVKSAKNIGAILDSNLTMRDHIDSVCCACYFHLHTISHIRPFLTQDATATLVCSLITSKLDYVNSILYGLPDYAIQKLQLVQNNAARLVYKKRKHEHVTPLLKNLHWLPIEQRIKYKVNLLTFKALHGQAPSYLRELINEYKPTRNLRSNSKGLMQEKKAWLKKGGDRAFSVCAPKLWNRLPSQITSCDTLDGFKISLKTHYFTVAFP